MLFSLIKKFCGWFLMLSLLLVRLQLYWVFAPVSLAWLQLLIKIIWILHWLIVHSDYIWWCGYLFCHSFLRPTLTCHHSGSVSCPIMIGPLGCLDGWSGTFHLIHPTVDWKLYIMSNWLDRHHILPLVWFEWIVKKKQQTRNVHWENSS